MFEPLPDVIRLKRKERNLTQEELAELAGVSRRQLHLFEAGEQNITLKFLLKVANALELTELPVGGLRLRGAAPELASLILAADAVSTVRRLVEDLSGTASRLDDASSSLDAIVAKALASGVPSNSMDSAIDHLQEIPPSARNSAGAALREVTKKGTVGARGSSRKATPSRSRSRSTRQ